MDGSEIEKSYYTLNYSADDDHAIGNYTVTITAQTHDGLITLKGSKTLNYNVIDPNQLIPDGNGGYYVLLPQKEKAPIHINIPTNVTTFKVYDDGGENDNYSNSYDGKLTLTAPEGCRLRISGQYKIEPYYDILTIYDGFDTDADKLAKVPVIDDDEEVSWTDMELIESNGRSVTLYMKSDNEENYEGLNLTVQVFKSNEPFDIAVNVNNYTEADVTWDGNSDSYDVKYRTSAITKAVYFTGFEEGLPEGWTTIDSDGDDHDWYGYDEAHSGTGCVASDSYDDNTEKELTPDNWLVSPKLPLSGVLKVWLRAYDYNYPKEHFTIYASTTGNTADDFTTTLVSETTLYDDEWREYTADLSGFNGEEGYIAIRHFNCENQFSLILDDFGIYTTETPAGAWNSLAATTEKHAVISGLEPNTSYDIQVTGTKGGASYDSKTAIFHTGVPSISLANNADNSEVIAANNKKVCDVTLQDRTLYKDGNWNTLYLPFGVVLDGSPLEGATARPLTSASISGTTLNLTFGDAVTTLQAGTPYIIKWASGSNIVSPVFSGVTINATDRSYDNNQSGDLRVRFLGTYKSTSFDAEDKSILFMGGNNNLYYPTTGASIGAQRAYFKIGEGTALAPVRLTSFSIDFGEGETTGIQSIDNLTIDKLQFEADAWYMLDGRRLSGKPTRTGVYIYNGKKIVIK